MKDKLETNSIQLTQKYINSEVAKQCIQFNKKMLTKLNDRALNRAFQLDRIRP